PLIQNIIKHRITFQPTDEDYKRFKAAGASDELIRVISDAAPPPPPPPPADPEPAEIRLKSGVVTINCSPAECIAVVNGGQLVFPTVGGSVFFTLLEGTATVSAVKRDYDADKKA